MVFSLHFTNNKKVVIKIFKIKITFKNLIMLAYSNFNNLLQFYIKAFFYNLKAFDFRECNDPIVTIIITSYKNFHITKACLKSINYFKPKVPFEIIIADDCSPDSTPQKLSMIKGIRVIQPLTNSGFGENVKNAIKYAKGKYIFLMNNDMLVTPNWLDFLYESMENDSSVGISGCLVLKPDKTIQECGCTIKSNAETIFNCENELAKDKVDTIEVDYCSGCSIMFSKSDWDKLGGFDEQFKPAYYEDTDFNLQVKYILNKKIVCVQKSQIYHLNNYSYNSNSHKYAMINKVKFYDKWKDILIKKEDVSKK